MASPPSGAQQREDLRFAHVADRVDLTGVPPPLLVAIEGTRPPAGELRQDGEIWSLSGPALTMRTWLEALEAEITYHGPAYGPIKRCRRGECQLLDGAEAGAYRSRFIAYEVKLRSIRIHTEQGWRAPFYDSRLIDGLWMKFGGKVGWERTEISAVAVQNLSGGKTLAAVLGSVGLSLLVMPVALLARGTRSLKDGPPDISPGVAGAQTVDKLVAAVNAAADSNRITGDQSWAPRLGGPETLDAKPLFSTGAKIRAIVRPTLAFDAGIASSGDRYGTGLIARLRFRDLVEIGGGIREVFSRDARGWSRSTTRVFQAGLHLPLDAGFRFAIPLGFEASGGGAIAHEIRIPWGLRYTSASGRYFVTATPATPSWMRTTAERTGHWAWNASTEFGVSF